MAKARKIFLSLALFTSLHAPAWANENLTLLLDWFVNPNHAQIIVAQKIGLFEKYDLDVEVIAPSDPAAPPKMVSTKQADIAVSYQPQLHLQVAEGLPLVRFATLINQPLNIVAVRADSDIKSMADMRGKRIGYSVAGVEEALMTALLRPVGLALSDVEMININFSLSSSLISGQVDAVIGAYRNFELNQMRIIGHPGRGFPIEKHGVPDYDELILLAHKDMAEDPRLLKFVAALKEATVVIKQNPEIAWNLFLSHNKAELDTEINRKSWLDTIALFSDDPGRLDREKYKKFALFLKRANLLKKNIPLRRYAIEPGTVDHEGK